MANKGFQWLFGKPVTEWERKDFGDPGGVPPQREQCERDTNEDLQKAIQQLVCDVYEEAFNQKAAGPEKIFLTFRRMVALIGRVGWEHERNHRQLIILTWAIGILTVALTVALLLQKG
jgi:hypothetical protein